MQFATFRYSDVPGKLCKQRFYLILADDEACVFFNYHISPIIIERTTHYNAPLANALNWRAAIKPQLIPYQNSFNPSPPLTRLPARCLPFAVSFRQTGAHSCACGRAAVPLRCGVSVFR